MVSKDEAIAGLIALAIEYVEEYDGEHCLNHSYADALAGVDEYCSAHEMAQKVQALIEAVA